MERRTNKWKQNQPISQLCHAIKQSMEEEKRTKRKNKIKTENNKEKNERRYEDRKEEPTMSLVNAQSKLSP